MFRPGVINRSKIISTDQNIIYKSTKPVKKISLTLLDLGGGSKEDGSVRLIVCFRVPKLLKPLYNRLNPLLGKNLILLFTIIISSQYQIQN